MQYVGRVKSLVVAVGQAVVVGGGGGAAVPINTGHFSFLFEPANHALRHIGTLFAMLSDRGLDSLRPYCTEKVSLSSKTPDLLGHSHRRLPGKQYSAVP